MNILNKMPNRSHLLRETIFDVADGLLTYSFTRGAKHLLNPEEDRQEAQHSYNLKLKEVVAAAMREMADESSNVFSEIYASTGAARRDVRSMPILETYYNSSRGGIQRIHDEDVM